MVWGPNNGATIKKQAVTPNPACLVFKLFAKGTVAQAHPGKMPPNKHVQITANFPFMNGARIFSELSLVSNTLDSKTAAIKKGRISITI